jgi:hypothetical protein
MKLRVMFGLFAVTILLFCWGCSDKKPTSSDPSDTSTTIWQSDSLYWETQNLDASSYSDYVFYSFAERDTVTLTFDQALSSTAWDIGFKRVGIILNDGTTGAGNVQGVDLAAINHPDSTDFMGFNDPSSIDSSDWGQGSYALVIDEWYTYSMHTVTPTQYVYIMQDAVGTNYVKFQIIFIENAGMTNMGTISIQYIYAADSHDFTGITPDTLTFNDSDEGPIYVDFSAGTTTNPTDPLNSTDWDISFENYEVHQNNTIFGSGNVKTYEVWMNQSDSTDFNETTIAQTSAGAYFADAYGSPMTDWYNYIPGTDDTTPQLPSKNHVYVIRDGSHIYKLQIMSYFHSELGPSVLGYYTFRWKELE